LVRIWIAANMNGGFSAGFRSKFFVQCGECVPPELLGSGLQYVVYVRCGNPDEAVRDPTEKMRKVARGLLPGELRQVKSSEGLRPVVTGVRESVEGLQQFEKFVLAEPNDVGIRANIHVPQ
jgi:hypothetical protein